MIHEILMQNGLTEKEARIYIAILEAGEPTIASVAQKSRLKRPTVYDIIDQLKEKEFVFLTKRSGINRVSALPPQILVDRFKRSALMAETLLPELTELAYSSPLKPRMRFYEGMNGLKEILLEMSYSAQQTVGFTDYTDMPPELFTFIRKEVVPNRRKRKNCIRLLVPDNPRNRIVQSEDTIHYGQHRFVQLPSHSRFIEIILFDFSKIGFLSFLPDELFGVIIDSPSIHETLRMIFELVWESAPRKNS